MSVRKREQARNIAASIQKRLETLEAASDFEPNEDLHTMCGMIESLCQAIELLADESESLERACNDRARP